MNQILDRITDVFRDAFDDDTLVLTRDTTAADIEGWDSMMQVSLIIGAEKAFGLRFSGGEISNLHSVGDLEDLVQRRLGKA